MMKCGNARLSDQERGENRNEEHVKENNKMCM